MKLRIAAAAMMVSILAFAAPAAAQAADEGSRPMGLRFETQMGLFNLVGVGGDAGFLDPQGDIKIGYDLDMGLTPLIGLGYRSVSQSRDEDGTNTIDSSASAIVLDIELRYYLQKHRRGLQPFVFGELNTSFVSLDVKNGNDDALSEEADKLDHTEVNLGLGMEYKFSRAFAVGGKWGLAFGFQPWEEDPKTEESNTTWGTSSSIYLAWRI